MESTPTKIKWTFIIPRDQWRYSTMGNVEIKFAGGVVEFGTGEPFVDGPITLTLEAAIAESR